jgi:predicted Zn-dependent protease
VIVKRYSILNKEQILGIGNTILGLTTSDIVRLQLTIVTRSSTRIANNRVMTSDNGQHLEIAVSTSNGGRVPVTMTINYLDDASIRTAITELDALTRLQYGAPQNYVRVPIGPQQYMPVALSHHPTIEAMSRVGETVVPTLIEHLRAAGLRGSGFVGLNAVSTLVMQKDGLAAFSEETDSECSVSARSLDGRSSGWWGQASRNWNDIQPDVIASKAIDMARRNANPSAVEPGRRTAILSPFAMAQILRHIPSHFDATATNEGKATAFSVLDDPTRENKIGLHVFDSRVRIVSDPADPMGGYTPFGDIMHDGLALPTRAMTYVDDGILKDLSYQKIDYALQEGKPFTQNPWSLRFEAKAGSQLSTIEEMIGNCEEGIFVHRLADVRAIGRNEGMQTGVTRDGCFLIKNGKINRPVKNFRFTDSPFFFLNRIVAIGKTERSAMGFVSPSFEPRYAYEWPRRPMIVPPVMVRDFNFTALSDAV